MVNVPRIREAGSRSLKGLIWRVCIRLQTITAVCIHPGGFERNACQSIIGDDCGRALIAVSEVGVERD